MYVGPQQNLSCLLIWPTQQLLNWLKNWTALWALTQMRDSQQTFSNVCLAAIISVPSLDPATIIKQLINYILRNPKAWNTQVSTSVSPLLNALIKITPVLCDHLGNDTTLIARWYPGHFLLSTQGLGQCPPRDLVSVLSISHYHFL